MKKLCVLKFLLTLLCLSSAHAQNITNTPDTLFYPGSLIILPEDGRSVYFDAFAAAQREIRIEICVLEDPLILQSLMRALDRGVRVRVIVDNNKYNTLVSEQMNLATYLTNAGGQLHLSNPIFVRSFPKVILIDDCFVIIGSACLDSTTFMQYRDYAYVSGDVAIITYLSNLFENDWLYSALLNLSYTPFNPTPVITERDLLISPVNSQNRLVNFIQEACESIDLTTELLGNPTLQSELAQAATRGLRVRLIAPEIVNGATPEEQALQITSLNILRAAGVEVHVTRPPESLIRPYMHARTAAIDGRKAYLGSISLSPDSTTYNREVGLISDDNSFVKKIERQFEIDFIFNSVSY